MLNRLEILQKPSVIFSSMFIGIIIGMTFAEIPPLIEDFGVLYIRILQMIATFMLPLAIVKSVGNLMQIKSENGFIKKVTGLFISMMFLISLLTISAGIISKPLTGVDFDTKKAIGRMMIQKADSPGIEGDSLFINEIDSNQMRDPEKKEGLADFLKNLFPVNIFNALAEGESIKIVFFSIVFGIALSYIDKKKSGLIIEISKSLYDAFSEILGYVMYMLPLALLSLMATQFRGITLDTVFYFSKFIIYMFLSIAVVFALCIVTVHRITGQSAVRQIMNLKSPLIISFVTNETITAMPSAIESVANKFGRTRDKVNLIIPLFISISVFGNIIVFTAASVFTLQLYEHNTGLYEIITIVIMSSVISFAAIDVPDMICLRMLTIITGLFSLPASAGITLLLILGPLFDPFFCMLAVYISCTAGVILSDKEGVIS